MQNLLERSGICPTGNIFGNERLDFAQTEALNQTTLLARLEEHRGKNSRMSMMKQRLSTEQGPMSENSPSAVAKLANSPTSGQRLPTLNLDALKKPTVPFGTQIKTKLRAVHFLKASKLTNQHQPNQSTSYSNYNSTEARPVEGQSTSQIQMYNDKSRMKTQPMNARRDSHNAPAATIHVEQRVLEPGKDRKPTSNERQRNSGSVQPGA